MAWMSEVIWDSSLRDRTSEHGHWLHGFLEAFCEQKQKSSILLYSVVTVKRLSVPNQSHLNTMTCYYKTTKSYQHSV